MKDLLACLFLKLICIKDRGQLVFACSFSNLNWTQKKVLPMRGLIYTYSLNLYKKFKKKQWNCRWEKMSKAREENK